MVVFTYIIFTICSVLLAIVAILIFEKIFVVLNYFLLNEFFYKTALIASLL